MKLSSYCLCIGLFFAPLFAGKGELTSFTNSVKGSSAVVQAIIVNHADSPVDSPSSSRPTSPLLSPRKVGHFDSEFEEDTSEKEEDYESFFEEAAAYNQLKLPKASSSPADRDQNWREKRQLDKHAAQKTRFCPILSPIPAQEGWNTGDQSLHARRARKNAAQQQAFRATVSIIAQLQPDRK